MAKIQRPFSGGARGNEHLTAVAGAVLLVLFLVEGATLLNLRSLLTVHALVGILLIPIVALKLASTGWRMLRYYFGSEEYVERGPPHFVLRTLIAPLIALSTLLLFATGVALLSLGRTEGTLVALHQASFVVWVSVTGVHVLAHLRRLPGLLRVKAPGGVVRMALVTSALAAGIAAATVAFPSADHLQDRVSARIGIDAQ